MWRTHCNCDFDMTLLWPGRIGPLPWRTDESGNWCNLGSRLYFTHVQSCDVTAFKVLRSGLRRYILHTCPKLWCNPCSKCYGVDCFGTYFTHVQSCDVTRVQSATAWTASVHTSHMSKAVMKPVFKVLRKGLIRYILHTCPKLRCNPCWKCYAIDCLGILHSSCFGPLISLNRSAFLAWMSKYLQWQRSLWF